MEIVVEDKEYIASLCCGCVNVSKKIYENEKLVGYKRVGEIMLDESVKFDINDKESLVSWVQAAIRITSKFKNKYKLVDPEFKVIK